VNGPRRWWYASNALNIFEGVAVAGDLGKDVVGRCGPDERFGGSIVVVDVWEIGQRYRQYGLDRALYDGARPGQPRALDQEQQQCIIAVACSPPPEGRARWTVRLLTEEAIRRKLVPRVGRKTIRVLLESHDLKPWREKNVVRGET